MTTAKKQTTNNPSLSALLSTKTAYQPFSVWLVGDTPLITHAWSEKAKREMLGKQVGATKSGREPRDPKADFVSSLYEMGDKKFGFPVTGVKNCIMSAAHKDKGLPRTVVQAALWLDAEMVAIRPALAGAMCDMPLVRIWGSAPVMREDMTRIGGGISKTATLAYRPQFSVWAMKIRGKFNATLLKPDALAFIIQESGVTSGLGEWRNERKGIFGAFHLADATEEEAWDKFTAGKGEMPTPRTSYEIGEVA